MQISLLVNTIKTDDKSLKIIKVLPQDFKGYSSQVFHSSSKCDITLKRILTKFEVSMPSRF